MPVVNSQITNRYRLIAAGTFTALAIANSVFEDASIVPISNYKVNIVPDRFEGVRVSLKHEIPQTDQVELTSIDKIIQMPVIRKIRVKIKPITPLEFVNVEDEDGFI